MELYANPECIQFSLRLMRIIGRMEGWLAGSSPPEKTTPLQLSLSLEEEISTPRYSNSAVRI